MDEPKFCAGCGTRFGVHSWPRAIVDGHRDWHFGCAVLWRARRRRNGDQPMSPTTLNVVRGRIRVARDVLMQPTGPFREVANQTCTDCGGHLPPGSKWRCPACVQAAETVVREAEKDKAIIRPSDVARVRERLAAVLAG